MVGFRSAVLSAFLHHFGDILAARQAVVGNHGHDHGIVGKGRLVAGECLLLGSGGVSFVGTSVAGLLHEGGGSGNGNLVVVAGVAAIVGHVGVLLVTLLE